MTRVQRAHAGTGRIQQRSDERAVAMAVEVIGGGAVTRPRLTPFGPCKKK